MSLAFFFFLLCLSMGLAAWTLFWLCVRSGQLKDPEAVAGEMLEFDELEASGPRERPVARRMAPVQGDVS